MTIKAPSQPVSLPPDWVVSGRGNTKLSRPDGASAAWEHIKDNVYLYSSNIPENSPRLGVTVIEATQRKIINHIRKAFTGWYVVRWNMSNTPPMDKEGNVK